MNSPREEGAPRGAANGQERLAQVLEIADAFNRERPGMVAFDRLLDVLHDAIPYTSCAIHLLDADCEQVVLVASQGIPASVPEPVRAYVQSERLDAGYMLPLRNLEPYRPIDARADEPPLGGMSMADIFEGEMVKVPLSSQGQLVGVMTLTVAGVGPEWLESERDWLSIVGQLTGAYIKRAWDFGAEQGAALMRERERISQEIHDDLSQYIGTIRLLLDRLADTWRSSAPEEVDADIDEVLQLADTAYASLRDEMTGLRLGAASQQGDLAEALRDYLDRFERKWGIAAQLDAGNLPDAAHIPTRSRVQLIRIVQEALANVRRHSLSPRVSVALGREHGMLQAVIADEGVGFDPASVPPDRLGIDIMRERAAEVGGTVEVDSSPGRGTSVTARLPLFVEPGDGDAR